MDIKFLVAKLLFVNVEHIFIQENKFFVVVMIHYLLQLLV